MSGPILTEYQLFDMHILLEVECPKEEDRQEDLVEGRATLYLTIQAVSLRLIRRRRRKVK